MTEKMEVEVEVAGKDFYDDFGDKLELFYSDNRTKLLHKEERGLFINTPLNSLRKLARDYNTIISFTNNRVVERKGLKRTQWVCIITVGLWEGIGRAPVEQVAKEMAALDILETLKKTGFELDPYALTPGFRICPTIFRFLNNICTARGLKRPIYVAHPLPQGFEKVLIEADVSSDVPYYYNIDCIVGETKTTGYSDDLWIAKLWATKKMVELLLGESYYVPYFKVKFGKDAFLGFLSQPLDLTKTKHTPMVKKYLDKQNKRAGVDEETVEAEADEEVGFKVDLEPEIVAIRREVFQQFENKSRNGDSNTEIDDLFPDSIPPTPTPATTSTSELFKIPLTPSQRPVKVDESGNIVKRPLKRLSTPLLMPTSKVKKSENENVSDENSLE